MAAYDDKNLARVDMFAGNPLAFAPIELEEMAKARLTPRVIVHDLLYADVRTRISAGGVGKTTIALYEAATIALGRQVWGKRVDAPCRTAIVSREDGREVLVARLREIMVAMNLTKAETLQVLGNVRIFDLSNVPFRLTAVFDDVVMPHTANIDALIERIEAFRPDWLIFDPLVSFGVGEQRVNDGEQGLIEAFRILRNRLDCCPEGIHHSGKANAREKSLDQYAGRGGSALSDGCRMVAVLQPLEPSEWLQETGIRLADGETGVVMALPKLSYSKKQESIFILRKGYHFARVMPMRTTPEQEAAATSAQVLQFLTHEYSQGRMYSKSDLESSGQKLSLKRVQIRTALTDLKVRGQVIYIEKQGVRGSHYVPITLAEAGGEGGVSCEAPQ